MTKVRVLLPFCQGDKSFGDGDEISLPQNLAYSLALTNVVEFKNKKEFSELDIQIKAKEKEDLEKKEEDEKRVAAILEKEYLERKRETLQSEVDSITHILDDGAAYYKSYIDLANDIEKKGK